MEQLTTLNPILREEDRNFRNKIIKETVKRLKYRIDDEGLIDLISKVINLAMIAAQRWQRKRVHGECAKWIRENVSDGAAVDYLHEMEEDEP